MHSVSLLLTKDVIRPRLPVPALTALLYVMNYNMEVLASINPFSRKLLFIRIFSPQQQNRSHDTMPVVFSLCF